MKSILAFNIECVKYTGISVSGLPKKSRLVSGQESGLAIRTNGQNVPIETDPNAKIQIISSQLNPTMALRSG